MRGQVIFRQKGQGKGSWYVKVNTGKEPLTGKYHQHWEAVEGGRREAQARLTEILHQLDTGAYVRPGKTTVADYLNRWLVDYCRPNLAPLTTQGYESIINNHLIPSLGKEILTNLKPEQIQHLISEKLSGGLSTRTVRYIHSTLHRALVNAVKLGMVPRNAADAVELPRLKRREMQTMNETDIHLFLEMARNTEYFSLFYFLLFTGCRRSEALALRWCDVDLLLCQISITRTIHQLHHGKIIFGETKTAKSRRLISLSPSTVQILREHREVQLKIRQWIGLALSDNDLVFCHYDGTPFLPDSITHAWQKLATRCGLKGIRLHDARHSHASLMLKQGIHPKVVQERLGHSSIAITLDIYSHVVPGLQEAAAKRFDDVIKVSESIK